MQPSFQVRKPYYIHVSFYFKRTLSEYTKHKGIAYHVTCMTEYLTVQGSLFKVSSRHLLAVFMT